MILDQAGDYAVFGLVKAVSVRSALGRLIGSCFVWSHDAIKFYFIRFREGLPIQNSDDNLTKKAGHRKMVPDMSQVAPRYFRDVFACVPPPRHEVVLLLKCA